MKTSFAFIYTLCILGWSVALPSDNSMKIVPRNILVDMKIPEYNANKTDIRVIGGVEAVPNSIPYMAAILTNVGTFCGASLISTGWALSAAHCTDDASSTRVILGAHRPLSTEATQVVINSRRIINHPAWDPNRLINDVSLIELSQTVTPSTIIRPITIAPANSESFAGRIALLSGWGFTSDTNPGVSETLQRVDLTIITTEECRVYAGQWAHETNVCTSGFNGVHNVGSCFGDSGGPLVVDGVQVGVVSFGSGQCASGSITSYARVSSYATWINSYVTY